MTFIPTRAAGLERLHQFAPRAGEKYAQGRNYDDGTPDNGMRGNVSQLSPWLHAGLISEAEVLEAVLEAHGPKTAESFISEVFWRVYFKGYLEQRPTIWQSFTENRDQAFAMLEANSGLAKAYAEATEGRTGIAAFDHWARELVQTGYLHNHARMWFASIWIFTLKLDWELGADFFLRHLADGDAASNTLSWRWVGGLHTAGKTYLATASNIARFTERHPDGPLEAEGLAEEAQPLSEPQDHSRSMPKLPAGDLPQARFALLLHDEGASHEPLALTRSPSLIISAPRPEARSPGEIGDIARSFAREATQNAAKAAADTFDCPMVDWTATQPLAEQLSTAGVEHVVTAYLPTGWTKDALWPELREIEEAGRLTQIVSDLSRATWPHARAGFFRVKKAIPDVLGELGLAGG
ncbi:DNA photolyase [Erythrobacter sp. SCSIO 43205]|nr:DNA photolyase [Erythrobacter sp. SCSIO 43205]